jgi:tetratricopeptide (TPR) repeat protein
MDFRRVLRYKNGIMLRFLRGFFKRGPIDQDGTPEERWSADFSKLRSSRFQEETEETYQATIGRRGLELRLKKARQLAWVEDPLYRYSNAVIEALVRFPAAEEGKTSCYAAAGLLFRYSDAGSYYSILISTKGFFRVDAVFNGTPMPLIGWTECPDRTSIGRGALLRVIALGDRLTFVVDDLWAAEIEDSTHSIGRIAFAVAGYDDCPDVSARLESFRIDSRSLDVEAVHYRWNSFIRVDPASRSRLAATFLSMGQPLSALVQLKRAWKTEARRLGAVQRSPKDLLMAAECAMRLSLLEEAEEYLDRCVEADSQADEARRAIAEKAKLLYLSNRYAELREHAEAAIGLYPEDATLRTLLGHAFWNLGAWERAAAAYEQAYSLDPDNGIIALNAAQALERIGNREAAFERYLVAAAAFLRAEAYDDLTEAAARLRELRPDSPMVHAVSGKRAYAMEDWKTAEQDLEAAAEAGSEDSAVHYLLALLRIRTGKRADALPLLERAVELEGTFPAYRFRLAETRFLLSGDPLDPILEEDLAKALELAPEDGWIANLAGQIAIARGDLDAAKEHTERASRALPEESAVLINRAELAYRAGDVEGALALLSHGDDPAGELANARGNILVRAERMEEADQSYEQALRRAPDESDFLRNRASCLIELGRYGEADELLSKLMDLEPGARTFDLIAYVAVKKGEYPRAEAAYRTGLERFPEDPALLAGLSWHYLSTGRWAAAEDTIAELEKVAQGAKTVADLKERLLEATTKRVRCAGCDRSWRVLKDASSAPPFRLVAEPPDDMPAGTCPTCGDTYCIGCGKKHLAEGRFVCPTCGARLKLLDEGLKKLLSDWVAGTVEH